MFLPVLHSEGQTRLHDAQNLPEFDLVLKFPLPHSLTCLLHFHLGSMKKSNICVTGPCPAGLPLRFWGILCVPSLSDCPGDPHGLKYPSHMFLGPGMSGVSIVVGRYTEPLGLEGC